MGMFEYTPQQTQVQISDIPQVKTTSKAAEAFDAISTMVNSVGTAYKNKQQIDYYVESLGLKEDKLGEKAKLQEQTNLFNNNEAKIIDTDNKINILIGEGKVGEAKTLLETLKGTRAEYEIKDNVQKTNDMYNKFDTLVNKHQTVFTALDKKDAEIGFESKMHTSLVTNFTRTDMDILIANGKILNKTPYEVNDKVASSIASTLIEQYTAENKLLTPIQQFTNLVTVKNNYIGKMKELGITPETPKYGETQAKIQELLNTIQDSQVTKARAIAQGTNKGALINALEEARGMGADKQVLTSILEDYNKTINKKLAEEAKANAAYNKGDIESSDIRAEDKKKIKNNVGIALLNGDWGTVKNFVSTNPYSFSVVKEEANTKVTSILSSLGQYKPDQQLNILKALDKTIDGGYQQFGDAIVSDSILNDIKIMKTVIGRGGDSTKVYATFLTAKKENVAMIDLPKDVDTAIKVIAKTDPIAAKKLREGAQLDSSLGNNVTGQSIKDEYDLRHKKRILANIEVTPSFLNMAGISTRYNDAEKNVIMGMIKTKLLVKPGKGGYLTTENIANNDYSFKTNLEGRVILERKDKSPIQLEPSQYVINPKDIAIKLKQLGLRK